MKHLNKRPKKSNKRGHQKKLGAWGESLAATHLKAKGYTILARNWRCAVGEIDLVAQVGETVVFVEVKTRRGRGYGTPEEGITRRKAQQLWQLAEMYLAEHELGDVDWQIDLVAVELDEQGKLLRCEHVPNVVWGW
ncbi:MAG: YraN family protein [Chloroflexi bacterium]|nr:MAG: YraN family protein [Chloroflexota bacterium]